MNKLIVISEIKSLSVLLFAFHSLSTSLSCALLSFRPGGQV